MVLGNMMNIPQPYAGHYFEAEWLKYDDETEEYLVPIIIRFKPYVTDNANREDTLSQDQSGREVIKSSFVIQVLEQLDYQPKDKIRVNCEDKIYTVKKLGRDYSSINTMASLMFPKIQNKPNILYLGRA